MTKNEALKLAIDGKKVRHEGMLKTNYLYWNGMKFIVEVVGGSEWEASSYMNALEDWKVIPEHVNWLTALAAYKGYKKVQSNTGEVYSLNCEDETLCVTLSEIEGKWLILD